jgi:hypothetical protein
MRCADRTRRYRSSVAVHSDPYSWSHPTGHAQHLALCTTDDRRSASRSRCCGHSGCGCCRTLENGSPSCDGGIRHRSSMEEELHALQQKHAPWPTEQEWYPLYGYLCPWRLPTIAHEICRLLQSNEPGDPRMALTVLDRWPASDERKTRTLAAHMLRTWLTTRGSRQPIAPPSPVPRHRDPCRI